MTKNEIAVELCKRYPDLPKSAALHAVEGVADILADTFCRGENLYLRGFGSFEVKMQAEKKARNINAGTTVIIPAQRIVKFKISKQLKTRLNNGTVD